VATSFHSYIGRNPKEMVHKIGTMQINYKLGRDAAELCHYICIRAWESRNRNNFEFGKRYDVWITWSGDYNISLEPEEKYSQT